jgi:hypothetical protein
MLRLITSCLLSVLLLSQAVAQNASFVAEASAYRAGVQDRIQVDYVMANIENLRSMANPDFKDFIITDGPFTSNNTEVTVVGNRMVQVNKVVRSYVIQPRRTGTLVIPPGIARDAAGKAYQSNELKIEVVPGSLARQQQQRQRDAFGDEDPFAAFRQQQLAMQQQMLRQRQAMQQQRQQPAAAVAAPAANENEIGKNLFIRVTVDKNKAYVGEQITASYKLYTRIPMNVSISKLPSLNGFWTQDFDIPRTNVTPTEEVVDGKKYQVFLLKKSALFPQQDGTLTLDPAEAEGTARLVQKVRQQNPLAQMFDSDPFFRQFGSLMMNDPMFNDDMFSTMAFKDVPVNLKSQPVKVTILPAPDKGKAAGYGGAVGQFTVSGKADKTTLTTDDVLTYMLTISGSGNFKLINAPKLDLPNGLSTYDPVIVDTITGRSTTISGSKIITYSVSAQTPGDYQLPAIPFTYFDPKSGSYVTLNTQPLKIHVDKGKNYHPALVKTSSLSDIHPIETAPLASLKLQSKPLVQRPVYWSLYAVPLFAFLGLAVWKRKEDELAGDTVKLKHRRANKVALKRLVTARRLLEAGAKQPFYEEVSKAIWLYLSDKLNIPLSSLSRERAHEALAARNISQSMRDSIDQTIDECETALYSPATGSRQMQQLYEQTVEIISKLEETVR